MKSQSEKQVDGIMALIDMHVKSVIENSAAGQMGVYSVTMRTLITMLVKQRDELATDVSRLHSQLADSERTRKFLVTVKEKWRRQARMIISKPKPKGKNQ